MVSLVLSLLLACLVGESTELFVILEPKEKFCAAKSLDSGDKLKFSYTVSGADEDKVSVNLIGPMRSKWYSKEHSHEGEGEVQVVDMGLYSLCFESSESHMQQIISLDLHKAGQFDKRLSEAKDSFTSLGQAVGMVREQFNDIDGNIKGFSIRSDKHGEVLTEVNRDITNATLIKFLFFVGLLLVQVVMLVRLANKAEETKFKKSSNL